MKRGPSWEKTNKQIELDTSKELVITELVADGIQRNVVLNLFKELEEKQFGTFIPGKKGKGGYSGRFVPNSTCPSKYIYSYEVSQIKRAENIAPGVVQEQEDIGETDVDIKENQELQEIQESEAEVKPKEKKEKKKVINLDEDLNTAKSHVLNSLWHLSKNLVEDSVSNFIGYVCAVSNGELLTYHRVRGGGKPTLEEAVSDIWENIKDKVKEPTAKHIDKKEAVISSLMGKGFVVLHKERMDTLCFPWETGVGLKSSK